MSDPAYDAITKARNQASSGNAEGAVDTLEAYLATDPHNTGPRMVLANIAVKDLNDVGYGLFQLNVVLDLEPDNLDAMKAKATVLAADKKNNKETKTLFEAILAREDSAEMRNAYARFLRNQLTDFAGAAEQYRIAISKDPDNFDYHQNYTVLLLNDVRDYAVAKQELERMLELKPDDAMTRRNYEKLLRERFDSEGNLKRSMFRRRPPLIRFK